MPTKYEDKRASITEVAIADLHFGDHVMVSNSAHPFVAALYKDFQKHKVKARRTVNCNGAGRGLISEYVFTSYEIGS